MKDDARKFETARVHANELSVVWPEVQSWLEVSLAEFPSLLTTDFLRESIANNRYALWVVRFGHQSFAVAVTEIVVGKFSAINVLAMGGIDMEYWIESFTKRLEDYARECNCSYIFEMGRKGWVRVLKPLGWTEGPVAMVRKVPS